MRPRAAVFCIHIAAAMLAASAVGCGIKSQSKTSTSFPDGITLTVIRPNTDRGTTSDSDGSSGGYGLYRQRAVIAWVGADPGKAEVEIDTLWLRNVNGKDYGMLRPGDAIVMNLLEGGKVTVNGLQRNPREVEVKSTTLKWSDVPKMTLQFDCNHPADAMPQVTTQHRPTNGHYSYQVKFTEASGSERVVDVIVDGLHLTVNDHMRSRAFKIDGINDLNEGAVVVIDASTANDRMTDMAKIVVNGQPLHVNKSKIEEGK